MDLLQQSAAAWKELTGCQYLLTYGFHQKLYTVGLSFAPEDYPHLAGFQYAKDVNLPKYTPAKIVDRAAEGKILLLTVQKAARYEDMIRPRLEALTHLQDVLEHDFTLYAYRPRLYPFTTRIKADYLISSHFGTDSFSFFIHAPNVANGVHNYSCCSIFCRGSRNYETNQRLLALLRKERKRLLSGEITVYLDRIKKMPQ